MGSKPISHDMEEMMRTSPPPDAWARAVVGSFCSHRHNRSHSPYTQSLLRFCHDGFNH